MYSNTRKLGSKTYYCGRVYTLVAIENQETYRSSSLDCNVYENGKVYVYKDFLTSKEEHKIAEAMACL